MTGSLLVVEHEPGCPPLGLADAAEDAGVALVVVRPAAGEALPRDLDGAAGLAVLGGEMGAGDTAEWPHLEDTMALLLRAHERGVPALGICLGAQLAAQALGGRAYRGEHGTEIGWVELALTPEGRADPVLGALPPGARVFDFHHDTFELPPGSALLARGGLYHQAFRLGSVVAIQFHAEVDGPTIAAWYDEVEAAGRTIAYDRADALAGVARHGREQRRVLDAFCRSL